MLVSQSFSVRCFAHSVSLAVLVAIGSLSPTPADAADVIAGPAVAPISNQPATSGGGSSVEVPEGSGQYAPAEPLQAPDPAAQLSDGSGARGPVTFGELSDPIQNFAGQTAGTGPPDTVGDIGSDHYIQMINSTFYQIWDKSGNSLLGPVRFGSLWPNGDICNDVDTLNQLPGPIDLGDPIVVFDHLADRWVLSQFASTGLLDTDGDGILDPQPPYSICVAVATSADPVNGPDGIQNNGDEWYLYNFSTGNVFPDYPKFGVWPDAYYVSTYEGSNLGIFVYDRSSMLTGFAAASFKTTIPSLSPSAGRDTRILPADLDGPVPPAGTPNFFVRSVDHQQDAFGAGCDGVLPANDCIEVFEAAVNWNAPSFSFTRVDVLTPAAFNIMVCNRTGNGSRDCIPQPDTNFTVDALSNRPMMQLKFRNFGTHFSMVVTQTIDVSGSINGLLGFTPVNEVAGARWYEFRKVDGAANWTIHDQGTFAAQPIGADAEDELLHRWMGSAAMDSAGNIALGYSATNSDSTNGQEIYPGIRYAARLSTDTPGQMSQGEKIILSGTNNTTNSRRWGDYATLSVDPVDDCTFWFTTHLSAAAGNNKPTQIASFSLASCNPTDLEISKFGPPDAHAGEEMIYTVVVRNNGPSDATGVQVVDTLPAGVDFISATADCTLAVDELTCELGDLPVDESTSFLVKIGIPSDFVVDNGIIAITNTAVVSGNQFDPDEFNNTASVGSFVQDWADLSVVKLCKPDRDLLAGEEGTCTVIVDNFGSSWAREVVVLDTMVSDGLFEVTDAQVADGAICSVIPGLDTLADRFTIVCNVGDMEPAAVGSEGRDLVELTVVAAEQLDINDASRVVSTMTPDPDIGNNESQGSIAVTAVADLALAKSGPATAVAGTSYDYDLTVTNNGPSTAQNVVIEDVVPAGVTIDAVTPQAPCSFSCNVGVPGDPFLPTTCDVGTLADGDSCSVEISVTVLQGTPDGTILHNDARTSSDTLDIDTSDNLASTDTAVEAEADLSVTKLDSPDPVLAGEPLTYELIVANGGPSKAVDVMLSDDLPSEVAFVGTTISGGSGTCVLLAGPAQIVECDLGDLDDGASVTVFVDVVVDAAVLDGTVINDVASVSSATTDPNAGNDSDSEDTTVNAEADLGVVKTSNFEAGSSSTTIIYTIVVTNHGPSDAQNVEVEDTLPLAGTSSQHKVVFVFESSNGACTHDETTNEISCDCNGSSPPEWCTLPAGTSTSFDIHVQTKGNLGVITNVVGVSSDTTDLNAVNDTDTKDVIVQGGSGKTGGPGGGRGR